MSDIRYIASVTFFSVVAVPAATLAVLRLCHCTEKNFRGETIPVSFGISLLISTELLLSVVIRNTPVSTKMLLLFVSTAAVFGLLGLLDDRLGDKAIKGLKGHFAAALRGKITTGFLKAIGGLAWSVYCAWRVSPHLIGVVILNGLLIALCANLFNLLDLRPGRSSAVFLLSAGMLLGIAGNSLSILPATAGLATVVVSAIPCWLLDSRAKVMLGDTGSNLLGGSLGLAIAMLHNTALSVGVLAILIFVHVIAERKSLTAVIAASPILCAMDKLTGIRGDVQSSMPKKQQ